MLALVLGPAIIAENRGESRVTARLGHPSSEDTTVTVAAAAVAPARSTDFSLSANTLLTIVAGETTSASAGTVTITAQDDELDGPNKIVRVTATVAGGRDVAAPPAQNLTITDDDGTPVVTLVPDPAEIGENGGVSTIRAQLSGAAAVDTTLQVEVTPNAPAMPHDFTLSANRMLTIGAGQTASTGIVTVTAVNNSVHAPATTLRVAATVAGVQGMAAPAARTLTVVDDEVEPKVALLLAPAAIAENGGRSTVTAELSGASSADTTVRVRAAQVGPPAAEYFTLSTNPVLRIAAGATASTGTVTITALDDPVDRPDREVRVTGEPVNAHAVTAPDPETLIINDDEAVPVLALVVSPGAIAETGGAAVVTARLGHPSGEATTVTVNVTPVTPAVTGDYGLSSPRVLTIAAGATGSSGVLTIRAVDNLVDAPDKTVLVGAAVSGGNGVAAPAALPLTIEDDEAAPRVTLALNPPAIGEKNGTSAVTATLEHESSAETTVTVAASPYDPPAGSYFTQTGTTLTIAAGALASTGAVTIAGVDDMADGADKRVQVAGTAANDHGVVDPAALLLTITNEEVPPALTLQLTPDEIGENEAVSTVTARLAYASGADTTLTVTASALDPDEGTYFTQAGSALTIVAGQTDSTGVVTVAAADDDVYGGNKTVRVAGSVTGGAGVVSPAPRELTIADDEAAPAVTLVLSASPVAENGGPVTVTATLSGKTATETTLTVTASNADPPGGEYFTQTGTRLTIAAGATDSTGTVTIEPVDDRLDAPDRTVQVSATVTSSGLAAPAAKTLTITDDEDTPAATLVLSRAAIVERGDPVTVTATLSGATSEQTTLTVTATPHDPPNGEYFTQTGTALTIAAGQTDSSGAVTVAPVDDGSANPDRTVQVAATASGGNAVAAPAAVQLEILDDEGAPRATFDVSPDRITENGGASEVTVRLNHPSSEQTELTVVLVAEEAVQDKDYTLSGDPALTIAATATSSATLTIIWIDNDVDEPHRTVTLAAGVDSGDTQPPANRDLTVEDDDATPRVTLTLTPDSIAEDSGSAAVTAALERASSEETTVTVTALPVLPAAAADFQLSTDPVLTIAAGATGSTATVTITAVDDSLDNPDKTVTVGGRAANAHGVRHPLEVALTITDDDNGPVFEPAAVTRTVVENTASNEAIGEPLTATDADEQTLTYHLGEEEDAAAFLLVEETGQLSTLDVLDYERQDTYEFTVEARDPDGNAGRLAVTVNVTDLDEPPGQPSPPTVTPAALTAVHATWTPPINTGPEIHDYDYRYRISDPNNDWEEVTEPTLAALEVTIDELVEDTTYDVQVRATNDEGTGEWSDSGTGQTDSNAWPMFDTGSGAFEVAENQTAVGSVSATDPDGEDNVSGYVLTAAGDASLFDFDPVAGTLAFKSPPDHEHPRDDASTDPSSGPADNVYVLVVTATSGTGARERTTERSLAVTVTDVDEPPGAPDAEVAPMSMTSLQVRWTPPPNTGPPVDDYDYRYREMTPPSAQAASASRSLRLAGAVEDLAEQEEDWTEVMNTEIIELEVMIEDLYAGTWYEVQVRAGNEEGYGPWSPAKAARTDAPPRTIPPQVTPGLDPLNSPPVFTEESAAFKVPENETEVGTVVATDPDADDSVTGYTIAGGADRERFTLDRETGVLAFLEPAPNFEDPGDLQSPAGDNVYVLVVEASSGTGDRERTTEQAVAVTVTDVDEPPEAPPAPAVTGTSVTSLEVAWGEPENRGPPITDYDYRYRTHEPRGSWTEVADTAITEREVTIEDLAPDTGYDVQVRASNDEGTGDWSESGTGATLAESWNYVVTPWLARFARTAAGHVLAGVEGRFDVAATAASQATVAGQTLTAGRDVAPSTEDATVFANRDAGFRTIGLREMLAASSFVRSAPVADGADSEDDSGRWAAWGRGDWSRFTGVEPDLSLDGDVFTGTIGADYARAPFLAGLALAYHSGGGSFREDAGDSGTLSGMLLSVHPYLHLTLQERLAVWGLLGYGLLGDLGLDPESAAAITADIGLLMGAFGARAAVVPAGPEGGIDLTAKADGLLLSARAEDAAGLVSAVAEVTRLRLLLEAVYRSVPVFGGSLTPALEVGVRYDDGDAERGAGLVLGGSMEYVLPAWGLSLSAAGRGLLLHQSSGFSEWGAGGTLRFDPGAPGRGVALSVAPRWGAADIDATRLWSLPNASPLADADLVISELRNLDAELSYGLVLPGEHGVFTPYVRMEGTPSDPEWLVGGRLNVDSRISVSLEGARRERSPAGLVDTLEVRGSLLF